MVVVVVVVVVSYGDRGFRVLRFRVLGFRF